MILDYIAELDYPMRCPIVLLDAHSTESFVCCHYSSRRASAHVRKHQPGESKNDLPRDDGTLQRVQLLVLLLGVTASASASVRIN